ncbi:MAG: AraC family ligand binding domain-containing protein, partial [Planctomycetes bacterium]|nr:AraC family ligand binding domain-containing protein [Planctomycetota bacterium]
MPISLPPGRDQDVGLQRITSAELFPAAGVPLHVNKPMHVGDSALHDHEFLEIAFMVDGHAVHRTIHGEQAVGRGDLILLHPGQWHAYEKAHNLVIYNCCFGVDLLMRELAWARTDPVLGCLFPARLPAAADRAKRSASQGVMALRLEGDDFTRCLAELEVLRVLLRGTDTALARGDIVAHLLLVLGLVARAAAADR